ncbi:MAG: DUF1385 domain-containing protein [Dehalococcoidia bacterium]
MIRGPQAMAVCVRKPDGELACKTEPNADGGSRFRDVPIVRGVAALGDTLTQGMRATIWSAQVAAGKEPEEPSKGELRTTMTLSAIIASTLFMLGPAIASRRLERKMGTSKFAPFMEGAMRVGTLVGYLRTVGRLPQAQRLFAYHGAEHRAIQAYEAGEPLEVETLHHFPNAHVRCGTSFLLTTTLVSSAIYAALGPQTLGKRLLSRLALTPLIAGLSYEALRLANASSSNGIWRLLFRPNLALQSLTTRDPDESQMEVAVAAVRAALAAHEVS